MGKTRILEQFYQLCDKYRDPRSDGWFLMDDYMQVVSIVILYLLFVGYVPRIMENRKPFNLRWLIIPYNFIMVILSAYIVYEIIAVMWNGNYSFICQPLDHSQSPNSVRMLNIAYVYFMSKIIELSDTVFFVLRKKYSQVSFLHVYHHASMPLIIWIGPHYLNGGQVFMLGLLNSIIHVLMYAYYGLAALGPHMQKYLWWKRYLTKLQLIQFVIVIAHNIINICVECDYPKWGSWAMMSFTIPHLILFSNFYYRSYINRAQVATSQPMTSLKGHAPKLSEGNGIIQNGNAIPQGNVIPNGVHNGNVVQRRQRLHHD